MRMTEKQVFERDYATDLDVTDPEFAARWEDVVADLHSRCPVAHSTVGEGYWAINGYDDLREAAGDWQTFSSTSGFVPNRPEGLPYWYPVECDPPLHDQIRDALNSYLAPKMVLPQEQALRDIADSLIDEFIEAGETEFVQAFSGPFPGLVFCTLIAGIPVEDMPWLAKAGNDALHGPVDGRLQAVVDVQNYCERFLVGRSEAPPRGDIVDALLAAEIEGFPLEKKAGTLGQLIFGGVGTTGHVLSSGIWHFAKNPDLAERFLAEPEVRMRAVEEMVRAFAPATYDGRRATKDVEVSGTKINKGDFVLLHYGAGCLDPRISPDPTKVDFDRSPNRHIAFGAGVHRCIGAHLARLELRVGYTAILERLKDLHVDPAFVPRYETGATRELLELPISFTPGRRVAAVAG
jgi:cytochrome P450